MIYTSKDNEIAQDAILAYGNIYTAVNNLKRYQEGAPISFLPPVAGFMTRTGILQDKSKTAEILAILERREFLEGVLETALEQGISYWAIAKYETESRDGITVTDAETNVDILVDIELVEKGIGLISQGKLKATLAPGFADMIATASRNNDPCDIDAVLADVIVQAGAFGEVRYA